MRDILKKIIFVGLFLVPFIPFLVSGEFFFPFISTKAFAWRVIVEIIFGAWAIIALIDSEYRLKKSPILYAVLGFLVVIGVADAFGALPTRSFWSNYERMEGYVSLLHLAAYFVVVGSVFREIDWKRWWNTSLVASAIMVCYALLQVLGVKDPSQSDARVDGTLGNAIYLAVYMLFHIFIAFFYMMREWKNGALRWVYGLLILLQLLVLYYTATRGAILGLIGGLLVLALLNLRNKENPVIKKMSIGIIALLVAVTGGFFMIRNTEFVQTSPVLSRFATLNITDLKTQGRYFIWPMALQGIAERPFLGWGQENFSSVFQKYYTPEMYNLEPWFDRAHNIFLDWAVAGGVIGLLFYLSLYVIPLYLIWKRENIFTSLERSIITALFAAYFFHNFFVFDHLISYILFFSVLAYIHTRLSASASPQPVVISQTVQNIGIATTVVVILTLSALYYVNIKPIGANSALITALQSAQGGQISQAMQSFEKAYNRSVLGRQETLEQLTTNISGLLQNDLPLEERNEFYNFAKEVMQKQSEILKDDTRFQLVYGTFLELTGSIDEAIVHLEQAKELAPNKQQVYFELATAYFAKNDLARGLEALKKAYELNSSYDQAKVGYLMGSIYANDRTLERELLQKFNENEFIFHDQILSTYFAQKRYADVIVILNRRIELDPANKTTYEQYIEQVKNSQ